jgi:CheY-like chemotaxis protein
VQSDSTHGALPLLHIDDSEADRIILREAIASTKVPFSLYGADSPESAKPFFHTLDGDNGQYPRPALIVLDYDMGPLTGADFLDWLRVKEGIASIPVVMLSGSEGRRNVAECYAKGATHFLSKPASMASFKKIIRSLYTSVRYDTPEPILMLPEYKPCPR